MPHKTESEFELFPRRQAGILLHPTSLPGGYGSGDLGPEAYNFAKFLEAAGISVWQTLPLVPTHADGSPYLGLSVHAGNPLLIDLNDLAHRGWLQTTDLPTANTPLPAETRQGLLDQAYQGFRRHADRAESEAFASFHLTHAHWLDDYALYRTIRSQQGERPWSDWPPPLRDRAPKALQEVRSNAAEEIQRIRFEQFLFFRQWTALKTFANARGIRLFGDIPIFVAYDSADVWSRRECFKLNAEGRPTVVAGVPPDYFAATGQLWGNPIYDWEHLAGNDFDWWVSRFETMLDLFDLIRLDHFRGFDAYWEIPAEASTAMEGYWVDGPGDGLFRTLRDRFGDLPLVAEDLGMITDSVLALRERWQLPGMRVFQFAFDGNPNNPFLPHNFDHHSVAYTGTHDNDTTLGWFQGLDRPTRKRILEYLGHPNEPMPLAAVRAVLRSTACLAILPMQDVLGLGPEARMNTPGRGEGNWAWRFDWEQVGWDLAAQIRQMLGIYGRR